MMQASARSQENSALVVELQAKLMEKEEEWQEFQAEVRRHGRQCFGKAIGNTWLDPVLD